MGEESDLAHLCRDFPWNGEIFTVNYRVVEIEMAEIKSYDTEVNENLESSLSRNLTKKAFRFMKKIEKDLKHSSCSYYFIDCEVANV